MKVWIDKQERTHYHKGGCPMIKPLPDSKLPPITYHYELIVRQIRRNKYGELQNIWVDGSRYIHCTLCFGDNR